MQPTSNEANPAEPPEADPELEYRLNGWLGTVLMIIGSIMTVLIFCDRTDMALLDMPAFWHQSRPFHIMFCLTIFVMAAVMLKTPTGLNPPPETTYKLFNSVRLLTRANCQLCEEAFHTLQQFQAWLPRTEIVDIDQDSGLKRQFGESVPVVEFDGKIRFRGAVNPVLLRRLLLATKNQIEFQQDADHQASLQSTDSAST